MLEQLNRKEDVIKESQPALFDQEIKWVGWQEQGQIDRINFADGFQAQDQEARASRSRWPSWSRLWSFLEGSQMVRLVGPNHRPLERHEFEVPLFRSPGSPW